jgi:hypothetical protein
VWSWKELWYHLRFKAITKMVELRAASVMRLFGRRV